MLKLLSIAPFKLKLGETLKALKGIQREDFDFSVVENYESVAAAVQTAEHYEKTLSFDFQLEDFDFGLVQQAEDIKKDVISAEHFEKVLEINPKNQDVIQRLKELKEKPKEESSP